MDDQPTTVAEATPVEAKQEAALDNLFPKSPAPSSTEPAEAVASVGAVTESAPKPPSLSEILTHAQSAIKSKVDALHNGVIHGTRLQGISNSLHSDMEQFKNFLKKEGIE